jgi:hypothetical protein
MVRVREPTVPRVPEKEPVPLVRVAGPGREARVSFEVKIRVPL